MDTIKLSEKSLQKIAALSGIHIEIVRDYIYYDWDNIADHIRWINSARLKDIAGWIRSCCK